MQDAQPWKRTCWHGPIAQGQETLLVPIPAQGGHKTKQVLSPMKESRTWITHLTCHPMLQNHLLCQHAAGKK